MRCFKKYLLIIVLLSFSAFSLFADDYMDGYIQGYNDALSGKNNIYSQDGANTVKSTQTNITTKKTSQVKTVKSSGTNTSDSSSSKTVTGVSGNWTVKYFLNSLGESTNQAYISNVNYSSGVYNDSRVTKGELKWYFVITEDQLGIVLLENGDAKSRVKGTKSHPRKYTVTVQDMSNSTLTRFSASNDSDKVVIDNDAALRDLLKKDNNLKIVIERINDANNYYNLDEFSPSGFKTLSDFLWD